MYGRALDNCQGGEIPSPLCGFLWGEDSERGQWHCLASGGLPGTHLCNWNPSSCCPGSVYILSPWGTLSGVSWKFGSFSHCPNTHWFLQLEVLGIYLPGAGTLGCEVWLGARITYSQRIPPDFYPPHVNVGPLFYPHHLSAPYHISVHLQHLCLSAPLTHLDECGSLNF